MTKLKAVWPPQPKTDDDILNVAMELMGQNPLRPVVAQIYAKKCLEERANLWLNPDFYEDER
jgi:hypothetical protein